jgi:F0F1-type ATP synthase membrane subunit a
MRPFQRYKTDRMWNINANIVSADVLSTAATAAIMEALHNKLPSPFWIVCATALIDGTISLAVFATLHWYGNRERGVRDLVHVQVHRWALAPLNYVIGSGLQYGMLKLGVRVSIGVLVAYWGSLAIVRTVHTLYGAKAGLFR